MYFRVYSALHDAVLWDAYFNALPLECQDVHFSSAYMNIQALDGGTAVLAVGTERDKFIMQPFIRRPIDSGISDLASVYSYGGPISNKDIPNEMAVAFQNNLRAWCQSNGVVTEQCSMHPLFSTLQEPLMAGSCDRAASSVKPVVVVDLTKFELKYVRRRDRRHGVVKAQNAKAFVRRSDDPRLFGQLYHTAMESKNALAHWRFSEDYFCRHDERVGARFYFLMVENTWHRALLTVGFRNCAYAHFLGSTGEYKDNGLDDLLYFEVAMDLKAAGFRTFHLGGGRTSAEDDSLFEYKRGFSRSLLRAARFGRVFDPARYAQLESQRALMETSEHGRTSRSGWFPAYRRPFE